MLHIVATMNCDPVALSNKDTDAPRGWVTSARAIEGFCTAMLGAALTPTLFLAPECAAEHRPMLDELIGQGVELGLLVHPPRIVGARLKDHLGVYGPVDQRQIIDFAAERFADTLGVRPRSFRSGFFSGSETTFSTLAELGFRQSSISRPGAEFQRLGVRWHGAKQDAHYASAADRLAPGDLPLFELPATTDPSVQQVNQLPLELNTDVVAENPAIQTGLIATRLAQMDRERVAFRALCLTASNRFDYYDRASAYRQNIERLLDRLAVIAETETLRGVTLSGAHERYRRTLAGDYPETE